MSEAFRPILDCYYNIALLIGQQAELIMQSPLLSTMYAYGSQQVIYIFDKMRVKGRMSKNGIHRDCRRLLTDDTISKNWRTPGLPIGNYYTSLGNKHAYFYGTQCVNENPGVVNGYNTTTGTLLYKHAFMTMWLVWWTVAAS